MLKQLDHADFGKLILRLTLGLVILFHGIHKLSSDNPLGFITTQLTSHGLPGFIAYGVYIGEIVAPIMLILGLKSRIGALIIAINMIFAIALAHSNQILMLNSQGGLQLELQAMLLFSALSIALIGGGKFAISRD